jgi:hypothetical protein
MMPKIPKIGYEQINYHAKNPYPFDFEAIETSPCGQ